MSLSKRQFVALFVSMAALGWSVAQAFLPPQPTGITVIALFASSLLWLWGSLDAEFTSLGKRTDANLLNAVAASFAAVAGVTTIDHGATKVWDLVQTAKPTIAFPIVAPAQPKS